MLLVPFHTVWHSSHRAPGTALCASAGRHIATVAAALVSAAFTGSSGYQVPARAAACGSADGGVGPRAVA